MYIFFGLVNVVMRPILQVSHFFGNRYAFHEKNGIQKVNNLPEKGELVI